MMHPFFRQLTSERDEAREIARRMMQLWLGGDEKAKYGAKHIPEPEAIQKWVVIVHSWPKGEAL